MSTFSVAIMAGGQSSRMGTDKAFVLLSGTPLIEHVLAQVAGLGQDHTILITNHPDAYTHLELPTFTDVLPGKGPLGGIYSAIHHSQSTFTLVVACDIPFVKPDLLRYMIGLLAEGGGPYDVIVPRVDGHPQGLHAIYSKACREPILARLEADRLKVIGFYDQVRVRYLDAPEYVCFDPCGLSFRNINTPEDLQIAERLIADQK